MKVSRPQRRHVVLTFIVVSIFFLIGVTKEYHWPMLKTFILVEVEKISSRTLPVKILAKELKLSLWPPALSLEKIHMTPQGELRKTLGPIHLDKISISPGRADFINGKFQLARIVIDQPIINIIRNEDQATKRTKPKSRPHFEEFSSLPIGLIDIRKMQIQVLDKNQDIAVKMNDLDVLADFADSEIEFNIITPMIIAKKAGQAANLRASLQTDFSITAKTLSIESLKVKKGKSSFIASGQVTGDLLARRIESYDLKSRADLTLPEIARWVQQILPDQSLPKLKGELAVQTSLVKKNIQQAKVGFSVNSIGLEIDQFKIGHLEAQGESDLTKNHKFKNLTIKNRSGKIELRNILIDSDTRFSAEVLAHRIQLQSFLENMGVEDVDLQLTLDGRLPCRGQIFPKPLTDCEGYLSGNNLRVGPTERPIVEAEQFNANGKVQVNDQEVIYSAKLELNRHEHLDEPSLGTSSGVINYEKGFDINFKSNRLKLSDIKSLSGLKLQGNTSISGKTKGDSYSATIDANISPWSFELEDFHLGALKTQLSYKKGLLSFKNISGNIDKTGYRGLVEIDVLENLIRSQIDFDDLYAADLKKIFNRKISIPFELNGNGSGQVRVWGPLVLNQMSYRTHLNLSRGSIGPESFNQLFINMQGDGGYSKINRFDIFKGQESNSASLSVVGFGKPNGQIEGQVIARKIRLEESELAQQFGVNIKSSLNFNIDLFGEYTNPTAKISGILSDTVIAEQKLPSSEINLTVNSNGVDGNFDFFKQTVFGEITIPFSQRGRFHLDTKIRNWDFIPIFGLINPEIKTLNFKSLVTADFLLKAPTGGFWSSTGSIVFDTMLIRRGRTELKNSSPMRLDFKNGLINSENFEIQGENSFLQTEFRNTSAKKINGSVSGKLDLSLLAFLTSAIEDLKGPSSMSFQLTGSNDDIRILGSAFVDGGYVKFKDFPHPLEGVKADLLVSQSKLLINSFFSEFAQGNLYANGHISLEEKTPSSISVRAEKLNILYPKGVKTLLSGTTVLSGHQQPMLLSGDVQINNIEITQEFDQLKPQSISISNNPFLPKVFSRGKDLPVRLDLDVDIQDKIFVSNSLMRANFAGQLKVAGNPLDPKVTGKLNSLPNGILKVQKTPFELQQAFLQFRGLEPMDPLLYAKANGRKEEFDIQFFLQGPLSTAQDDIQLTSSPELEKEAIVRLLAFGVTGDDTDGQAFGQVGTVLGDRLIPPDWKERFGLGVVYDEEGSDANLERKVGIQGRLGEKIGITATRETENDNSTEVRAEYEWNKNFSTILSWEAITGTATDEVTDSDTTEEDTIGLDVELKFNF